MAEAMPLTAADVAAVTDKRDGYGYGMDWIWIIVLFAIFGFGGNGFGFGRNGGAVTQMELQQGFDTQNIVGKLDRLGDGLASGFYTQARDLCTGFAAVNSAIAENRFAAQQCCCETNRNIDAVRYENAKNTCDIVRAIEKDGDATRALITQNTMQALRDKLADKDRDIQTRDFQLSQLAQNAYLVNKLQPTPIPAYPTCSPYEAANYYHHGFGCGCGCNV